MLYLASFGALALAHLLPGRLLAEWLRVGRDREERWIAAAVLGGPLAASAHAASLLLSWAPLYWVIVLGLDAAAWFVVRRSTIASGFSSRARRFLLVWVSVLLAAYLGTTGRLYRLDGEGNLLLDRALQRDALFHVGVSRSLETDYPPSLLSVSGLAIGYHVGYHLQTAAWSRHFGIDAFDGLIRLGSCFEITLLVLTTFMLARRFTRSEQGQLLATVLVLCAGFGGLAFFRPSVDWWSLVFMDPTLVSVFLLNPLLPAIPLAFLALALGSDFIDTGKRGPLLASALAVAFLLAVKMFLGAQLLLGLGLAAIWERQRRRTRFLFATVTLASAPLLAHTLLAARSSNTSVGLRPLEIVRYSMEKLDWDTAARSLASFGRFEPGSLGVVLAAFALWLVGFLGLRALALPGLLSSLRGKRTLERVMALAVVVGFGAALVFRIAPAESEGLSRLEAQNDIVWFAAQGGILLWFWVARYLENLKWTPLVPVILFLALPATVQHFAYAASLEPDRIGSHRVRAAREARRQSSPDSIWIDPLDRSRPSLLPYVSGRAVVYDPYVGYDYMFVSQHEIDFRHHAVAQFWASEDTGYLDWFVEHFRVDFIWEEGRLVSSVIRPRLDELYGDEASEIRLSRIRPRESRASSPISTPTEIHMGGRGNPFLGSGFSRDGNRRLLEPGTSYLYLPRERGEALRLTWSLSLSHASGELSIDGQGVDLSGTEESLEVDLPPRDRRGLDPIEVTWRGVESLPIRGMRVRSPSP
jgi:hypothetical protein